MPINWAKTCPTTYNPNMGAFGQNMYLRYTSLNEPVPTVSQLDLISPVDFWYSEVSKVPVN